jgi:hypothetical protein
MRRIVATRVVMKPGVAGLNTILDIGVDGGGKEREGERDWK